MSRKNVTNFRGELHYTPNGNVVVKYEPVTPNEDDFGEHNNLEDSFENICGGMRKSLSMSDITSLQKGHMKYESSSTMQDTYNGHSVRLNTHKDLSKTKFVSMAESIHHYQTNTPDRFHTVGPRIFRPLASNGPKSLTVPHSPRLRCKTRSRPQHILSQKEIEEIELEQIKKFKLKAKPVPKSVIEGGHLPEVPKKPTTIPEPFHLTEVQKKLLESPEHVPIFKARPAPKHILEKPKLPCKPLKCITRKNKSPEKKVPEKSLQRLGPVKPEPFSFDKRDEHLKKRREERLKQQIEEQKLATKFKAQLIPAAVKKRMYCATGTCCTSNTSSENKENHCKNKVKPQNLLKPVLFVEPVLFQLNTEKRALEREKFDRQLKEREEQIEKLKKQKEQEQLQIEKKALVEHRANLVHHAKPVPPLEPFVTEKSVAPITVPETPKFVRRLKQH